MIKFHTPISAGRAYASPTCIADAYIVAMHHLPAICESTPKQTLLRMLSAFEDTHGERALINLADYILHANHYKAFDARIAFETIVHDLSACNDADCLPRTDTCHWMPIAK